MSDSTIHADVRLGAQGRLVVPASIRKALGFRPGETLVARIENGHLVIEKPEAVERRLHAHFRKFEGRSLAEELIAERREEARREGSG
ncbi:MAG: AbrB/MazE/SpoVT family DNA-binding domain-containing protein [Immundisolibacterales bacterium]|nr:AbrB/MazE/SpoVT family DNA-binding domain-containing protein [Immundisolibacterales bacterium]